MGEDEIRSYLNGQARSAPLPPTRMRVKRRAPAPPPEPKPQSTFENFNATHLFCATCKQAMPVRERLMLYLADGDLYDYQCEGCGNSLGTRKAGR